MDRNQKKEIAKTLYLKGGYTQADLADKMGVTRQTVQRWANTENWDELKRNVARGREELIARLYKQLDALNQDIDTREQPYPNSKEVDIIKKLTASIHELESVSITQVIDVFTGFQNWLLGTGINNEAKNNIIDWQDSYVKSLLN